jgi:hypothetical protein
MATADFTIADVLDEARSYVERGWCQCRYGENANGERVSAGSDEAVRWCATGAIERAAMRYARRADVSYFRLWSDATEALDAHIGGFRTCWNDSSDRTQAEVVAAFRACVDALRGTSPSEWSKLDAYLTDIEAVSESAQ